VRHCAPTNNAQQPAATAARSNPIASPTEPEPTSKPAAQEHTTPIAGQSSAVFRKRRNSLVASLPILGYQVASNASIALFTPSKHGRSISYESYAAEGQPNRLAAGPNRAGVATFKRQSAGILIPADGASGQPYSAGDGAYAAGDCSNARDAALVQTGASIQTCSCNAGHH
jgi:hypothetical protein